MPPWGIFTFLLIGEIHYQFGPNNFFFFYQKDKNKTFLICPRRADNTEIDQNKTYKRNKEYLDKREGKRKKETLAVLCDSI